VHCRPSWPADTAHRNLEASSQLEAFGKLAPPRRQIVHLHRTAFENGQPILILGQATEYYGILLGVEYRLKVIAWLRGYQVRWQRQSALGV
jgi:hypothetical protein